MKKRNFFYPIIVIALFPLLWATGMSIIGCIICGILLALPIYFFCLVMKLPVWIASKHKKPTAEVNGAKNILYTFSIT